VTFADDRIFTTIFTCHGSEVNVESSWNPAALQQPADMQREVQEYWARLPKENIFNGQLARLDHWSRLSKGCKFELSPTDYRTLLYSNSHVEHICKTWGSAYLSRALGISAVLLSSDDYILFMKRSTNVGEYPECYDVFGGHIDVPSNGTGPNVFESMAQELEEEAGLDRADYILKLVGLIESTPNRKPELVFIATAHLTKEQIISHTRQAKDQGEFSCVHALENGSEFVEFVKVNKFEFSPSAFGSICMYLSSC
jgi:8-oxo-dGTP pyrophosphatase MutT (NUDIX family)